MNARAIRQFIHELFQSQYSRLLEQQLIEARTERDYFKGRMERIEQMRYSAPVIQPIPTIPSGPVVGRKTMAQLQQEQTEKDLADAQAQKAKH